MFCKTKIELSCDVDALCLYMVDTNETINKVICIKELKTFSDYIILYSIYFELKLIVFN